MAEASDVHDGHERVRLRPLPLAHTGTHKSAGTPIHGSQTNRSGSLQVEAFGGAPPVIDRIETGGMILINPMRSSRASDQMNTPSGGGPSVGSWGSPVGSSRGEWPSSPTTPGLAMLQVQQPWRRRKRGLSVVTGSDSGDLWDVNALGANTHLGGTEGQKDDGLQRQKSSESSGSVDKDGTRKRDKVYRGLSRFVLKEDDVARRCYEVALAVLLVYTGTIFPYRLCFHEFRIPEATAESPAWNDVEVCVDCLFWCDLALNFFISFRNSDGTEVFSLVPIGKNYLKGYFWVNLIACIPPDAVQWLMKGIMSAGNDNLDAAARVARLQRISRLARLARLLRLVKVIPLLARTAALRRLRSSKPSRFCNFVAYLIWSVHLLACGWDLCAYFHAEYDNDSVEYGGCWVARRELPGAGNLLQEPPWIHWGNSMYFVLTVFTTVGFGDISALTLGEIVYACFTMLMGTLLNSIIMSEMINIITFVDQAAADVKRQKQLITTFADHTELEEKTVLRITKLMDTNRVVKPHFDRAEIQNLMLGGLLPQDLVANIPRKVYQGRMANNRFLRVLSAHTVQLPTRFSVMMALHLTQQHFLEGEFVYRCHEHPLSIYLVIEGTFAAVARVSKDGGVPEMPPSVLSAVAEFAKLTGGCGRSLSPASSSRNMRKPAGNGEEKKAARSRRTVLQRMKNSIRMLRRSSQDSDDKLPDEAQDASATRMESRALKLYPYKLFGTGNYFGDVELLSAGPRRYTVRCENAQGSSSLVLHKADFKTILEDYPQFGAVWRKVAPRQEAMRVHLLQRLTTPMSCRNLAASMIQQRVRELQGTAGDQFTKRGRLISNPRWSWVESRRGLKSPLTAAGTSERSVSKPESNISNGLSASSDHTNPRGPSDASSSLHADVLAASDASGHSPPNPPDDDTPAERPSQAAPLPPASLPGDSTSNTGGDRPSGLQTSEILEEEKLVNELRVELRQVRSGQRVLQDELEALCKRLFDVQKACAPLLASHSKGPSEGVVPLMQ